MPLRASARPADDRGTRTGAPASRSPLGPGEVPAAADRVWFALVLADLANNPLIGYADAMRIEPGSGLVGLHPDRRLEVLRQIHFLISEHWAGYHRFWTHTVFGGFERRPTAG